MIVDEIRRTMEHIEELSLKLGHHLPRTSYYIEDAGCPHKQPSLPKGYAAIYIFVYESGAQYECL